MADRASRRAARHLTRRHDRTVTAAMIAVMMVAVVAVGAPPAWADPVRDAQWHLNVLQVRQAHQITKGAGVTVAVLDSGVDPGHPDLAGAVLPGIDVAPVPAGHGDGHTDTDGHGTAMAGLIAARGRPGAQGVLGIAPQAKILPVRIKSADPGNAETAAGIAWAVAHGADVISMSYAGPEPSDTDRAAITAAQHADVVLIASAGNTPLAQTVQYPAAYPGVLAVAGVDRHGRHAKVSVTGPQIQLAAPAVDVVSTNPQAGYHYGEGTSDAAAIVAGAAALIRARYPRASAAEVVHRLTATARDAGPDGRDNQYGHGVLNLMAALSADIPPPATTTPATKLTASTPARQAVPPPVTQPDRPPTALIVTGLAWLLLLLAATGTAIWLLTSRRHHPHPD